MPLSTSFSRIADIARSIRFRRCLTSLAVSLLFSAPAFADQVDSHDTLVQQLVQQQHAPPLVADCAAHAAFVVPTSPVYDHVEFLPSALDDQHASVEPWNQPFDDPKQHITVDTMVLVNGLGYRKNADTGSQPDLLKFRCGYVADKLLAFAYNEPLLHETPHYEGGSRGRRRTTHGRHAAAAHGARTSHGASRAAPRHGSSHSSKASTKTKATTQRSGAKHPAQKKKQ